MFKIFSRPMTLSPQHAYRAKLIDRECAIGRVVNARLRGDTQALGHAYERARAATHAALAFENKQRRKNQ